MSITSRVEDYLEAILDIEMSGRPATVTQIAKNLGVTKATIAAAMKKLRDADLLEHENYGDVFLTDAGRETALTVYRRHEFLTDFFVRILGFSRERAAKVSCVMEHEIDAATERRLGAFADALDAAERGGAEWLRDLKRSMDEPRPLPVPMCMMDGGEQGTIARITAQNDLRTRLTNSGFMPGVEIAEIKRIVGERGAATSFMMNGIGMTLGASEASCIWLYRPKDG